MISAMAVPVENGKAPQEPKIEKVTGPNKQDTGHSQLPLKQIGSDSKETDPDMYKTQKLTVPITVLEEEDSINSHNAKSVDLSEHGVSQDKVCSVAQLFKDRLQAAKK